MRAPPLALPIVLGLCPAPATAADPVIVDGVAQAAEYGPALIFVHQGERSGVFLPSPSGDDLYLFWLETTRGPARSALLPPCAEQAAAMQLHPSLCQQTPALSPTVRGDVRIAARRDGPTAELRGLGRGTEQWIWQQIPAQASRFPPDVTDSTLPGWTWDAPAWGVGVPLFLPPPVGAPLPMIIGHRGSPGRLPDHTLEGYTLAVEQGADAIEPDLVITRDGVLIARHENELSGTTDVARRFPDRRRTAVMEGTPVDGWFAEDFTLAEIRTLRAVQPWPDRPHEFDGLYAIPTFDEVLDLAERLGKARGRPVAVIPETKHPSYFAGIGLPLEPPLIASLRSHGLGYSDDPVVIQSFELQNLAALKDQLGARRLLLIGDPAATIPGDTRTYGSVLSDLRALREAVECLGVPREMVWGDGGSTGFLEKAHAAGLQVYVWTFRAERPGPAGDGDVVSEIAAFLKLGVDGVFADQPDLAVRARDGGG